MNTVTSELTRRGALEPAMDAQVHNADQARLIHNASAEVDSLAELLVQSVHTALRMARLLSDLAASNGMELDCEQMIAGFADDVTATLRHCEHNTPDGPLSGRRLAAQVAEHLDALAADPVGREGDEGWQALRELFRAVPRAALFADTTLYHLGARRARALQAAHAAYEHQRADRDRRHAEAGA